MSDLSVLDPKAVNLQFGRRAPVIADAAFLLREVERRMFERLDYVRLAPRVVADVGCGAGDGAVQLQSRYPQAAVAGLDAALPMVVAASHRHGRRARHSLADRLRGWFGAAGSGAPPAPIFAAAQAAALPLRDASVDLIWSNLAWHWFTDPQAVAAEWYRVVRPGALLMFSTFGVDTLRELARIHTVLPRFPDLHDVGDLLAASGFADPVTDCERLTVTWSSAEKLFAEVRALGGNAVRTRARGLRGRAFRARCLDAIESLRGDDGQISLTFEIVYAHAWCPASKRLPDGYAPITFTPRGGRAPADR